MCAYHDAMPLLLDRRQFLFTALTLPAAARRAAPSRTLVDRGFARVERLADGVYVTLADPGKGPQCLSNKPIRAAVDTHHHLDHTFGNTGYQREGIAIIAHDQVPALMRRQYAAVKGTDTAALIEPFRQRVARAATPAEKKRYEDDLGAEQWMYGAIQSSQLAYPTELLDSAAGRKTIDLGGLEVVIESQPGHTPGDVTISVPGRDVMFVGDLLFHREYPVSIDADMIAWRNVLGRLVQKNPRTRLVPGHGPVCGRDIVAAQMDLMDDLGRHAERMRAVGASADEAAARYVVPARFRGYEIFAWSWTVGAALESFYAGGRSR